MDSFAIKALTRSHFDSALQMEIDVVPEPSTWAMMLVGFAGGLGLARRHGSRRTSAHTAKGLLRFIVN
jgi:PEP-CTERM motif